MGTDGEESPASRFEELKQQYEETGSFEEQSSEENTETASTDAGSQTDSDTETPAEESPTKFEQLKQEYDQQGGFEESDTTEETDTDNTPADAPTAATDKQASREDDDTGATSKFEQLKNQYEDHGEFGANDETEEDAMNMPASESSAEKATQTAPETEQQESTVSTTESAPQDHSKPASQNTAQKASKRSDNNSDTVAHTYHEQGRSTEVAEQTARVAPRQSTAKRQPQAGQQSAAGSDQRRPYVGQLPSGYWAERAVIEWIGFLVSTVGREQTREAIAFYESLGWIGEHADEQLREYLLLFESPREQEPLTMEHHTRSLEYIAYLDGQRLPRR